MAGNSRSTNIFPEKLEDLNDEYDDRRSETLNRQRATIASRKKIQKNKDDLKKATEGIGWSTKKDAAVYHLERLGDLMMLDGRLGNKDLTGHLDSVQAITTAKFNLIQSFMHGDGDGDAINQLRTSTTWAEEIYKAIRTANGWPKEDERSLEELTYYTRDETGDQDEIDKAAPLEQRLRRDIEKALQALEKIYGQKIIYTGNQNAAMNEQISTVIIAALEHRLKRELALDEATAKEIATQFWEEYREGTSV